MFQWWCIQIKGNEMEKEKNNKEDQYMYGKGVAMLKCFQVD